MSNFPYRIKTITSETEFRSKEKGSLFIGISSPINSEEEAIKFLNSIKKKYYDATHHCYSYKLADGSYKYSDDGEPNGTAGIRIYNAQNHFELTNLISVVVRYFGGVKLGIGPLGKAYYDTAYGLLQSVQKIEKILHINVLITYKFEFSNLIHRLISKYSVRIEETLYNESPQIKASIPLENSDNFINEVKNSSLSQIEVQLIDLMFYI